MKFIIGFIFPPESAVPIGGYKIAYEYANRLVSDDYDVVIMYRQYPFFQENPILKKLQLLHGFYHNQNIPFSTRNWFPLDIRIKEIRIPFVSKWFMPKCDVYVALPVAISYELNKLKISNSRKFYFIQGYENWGVSDEFVIKSYKLPLQKIVISKWLLNIIKNYGEEAYLIPNGFDFNYFSLTKPIEYRKKTNIAFMFHTQEVKGIPMAMQAFELVKKKFPELVINTFSAYPRPENLPEWYNFYYSPDRELHNYIYNDSAIYVGSSRMEGWGLTVGEAMICGCAVACTDNKGYLEMAKDGETALVSPVDNAEALAKNIIRLIEDNELRYRIAKQGNAYIKQFDIEKSYQKFRMCISDLNC